MVTRILFDPRRDLPTGIGTISSPVTVEATPTGIREDGSTYILPSTLTFTINTAADPINLPAPVASIAWRLAVKQAGISIQVRTVRFADVPSITWQALTDVDPASLTVTAGAAAQWNATFAQLVALIADSGGTPLMTVAATVNA